MFFYHKARFRRFIAFEKYKRVYESTHLVLLSWTLSVCCSYGNYFGDFSFCWLCTNYRFDDESFKDLIGKAK